MKQKKLSLKVTLPDESAISDRFSFIQDEIVKENVSIYARYVSMLYSFTKEYAIPPDIIFSIYKSIIIYCGQIAEASVYSVCEFLLKNNHVDVEEIMGKEWKPIADARVNFENIHKGLISSGIVPKLTEPFKIQIDTLKEETNKFSKYIHFKDLVSICKRCDLFDKQTTKSLEVLQQKRNKIHVGALEDVDNIYKIKDIEDTFEELKEVINTCSQILEDHSI